MNLAKIFKTAAYKKLVACDLPKRYSHQHELTGVKSLQTFFEASGPVQGQFLWAIFPDNEDPTLRKHEFTFYDSRAKSSARTGRSEWRLYYHGEFLETAAIGDLIVLLKTVDNAYAAIVAKKNSVALNEISTILGINDSASFRVLLPEFLEGAKWPAETAPLLTKRLLPQLRRK